MEGAYAQNAPRGKLFPKAKINEEKQKYLALSPDALSAKLVKLENQMYEHAHNLEFEQAAQLRDLIHELRQASLGR